MSDREVVWICNECAKKYDEVLTLGGLGRDFCAECEKQFERQTDGCAIWKRKVEPLGCDMGDSTSKKTVFLARDENPHLMLKEPTFVASHGYFVKTHSISHVHYFLSEFFDVKRNEVVELEIREVRREQK